MVKVGWFCMLRVIQNMQTTFISCLSWNAITESIWWEVVKTWNCPWKTSWPNEMGIYLNRVLISVDFILWKVYLVLFIELKCALSFILFSDWKTLFITCNIAAFYQNIQQFICCTGDHCNAKDSGRIKNAMPH